jgi:SOS-response transcriptional repressor LexA
MTTRPKSRKGSTLGERLMLMLEKRQMSQHDLAKQAGMSQQSVNYLVNPNQGTPEEKRSERVVEMSLVLGCDPVWLATGKGSPFAGGYIQGKVANRVPLLNVRQVEEFLKLSRAGKPEDIVKAGLADRFASCDSDVGDGAFAVTVWGDCMSPNIRPGDRIIIDPAQAEAPGETVLARIEESGTILLRTYRPTAVMKGKDVFALIPKNAEHPTIQSNQTRVSVLGVVVESHSYRSARAPQALAGGMEGGAREAAAAW